jgi:septal ring-binding cell division protein DamX
VIACQGETLQNAAGWLSASSRDVFIVPMAMRNGQSCNQLFLGTFASKAEAEAEIPRLPAQFREGGNKPRPYQVSEIPVRQ